MNWAAGSFVFCRHDAFQEIEGFDEQYFAAEELYFSSAVKAWCRQHGLRFTILRKQAHASSARKIPDVFGREMIKLTRDILFAYRRTVRNQAALDFFYDGRR